MRIKDFREGVHSDVEIIFLDGWGLFMELIVIASKTIDWVDESVNDLTWERCLVFGEDWTVVQICQCVDGVVQGITF